MSLWTILKVFSVNDSLGSWFVWWASLPHLEISLANTHSSSNRSSSPCLHINNPPSPKTLKDYDHAQKLNIWCKQTQLIIIKHKTIDIPKTVNIFNSLRFDYNSIHLQKNATYFEKPTISKIVGFSKYVAFFWRWLKL
jgi:hypothetical protein